MFDSGPGPEPAEGITEAAPLAGITLELASNRGIGELPSALHAASIGRQRSVLANEDPPPSLWFSINSPTPESILKTSIPIVGALHLLGNGVMRLQEAWTYDGAADAFQLKDVQALRMPLAGSVPEFYLPAGVTDGMISSVDQKMTAALAKASWLRTTLEHMLLALDHTGLSDGLLDLTISMESLIRINQEVSFRFSHQVCRLAKTSPTEIAEY